MECPPLSNPENGFVSHNDGGYAGDTAVYTCSSDYKLVGIASRVCQVTERWNGSQPYCSRNHIIVYFANKIIFIQHQAVYIVDSS